MPRNDYWDLKNDAPWHLLRSQGLSLRTCQPCGFKVFDRSGNTGYGPDARGAVAAYRAGFEHLNELSQVVGGKRGPCDGTVKS